MKQSAIFVTLRGLKMKKKNILLSQNRSQFKNIFHNTNIPNFLSHQNYGDLEMLLSMLFKHKNAILDKSK
jgi:hypothetical protein